MSVLDSPSVMDVLLRHGSLQVVQYNSYKYWLVVSVFFFKQKTAYEIQYGLVGSEMCIRDRARHDAVAHRRRTQAVDREDDEGRGHEHAGQFEHCLLYTSDAADERSSVDLGGRRIIKKKKSNTQL